MKKYIMPILLTFIYPILAGVVASILPASTLKLMIEVTAFAGLFMGVFVFCSVYCQDDYWDE